MNLTRRNWLKLLFFIDVKHLRSLFLLLTINISNKIASLN